MTNPNLSQVADIAAALRDAVESPYVAILETNEQAVSIAVHDVTGEDTIETTSLPTFGEVGIYSGGLTNPNVKSDAVNWLQANGWETVADRQDVLYGPAWRVTEPLPVRPAATDDLSRVAVAASRIGQAEEARDQAIRDALDAGHSVIAIAEAADLSRARIYQIRDGRR